MVAHGADDGERETALQEVQVEREAADTAVAGGGLAIPGEERGHEVGTLTGLGGMWREPEMRNRHGAVAAGPLVLYATEDEGVEFQQDGFGEQGLVGDEALEQTEGDEVFWASR